MSPFQRAYVPASEVEKTMAALRERAKTNPDELRALLHINADEDLDAALRECAAEMRNEARNEVFLNDVYQVSCSHIKIFDYPGVHLSIKRIDRAPLHDWRELQQIKNELVGPEYEAVELYPAESRVVDTANQYHLWVIIKPGIRFPFGFNPTRAIRSEFQLGKSVNRNFKT